MRSSSRFLLLLIAMLLSLLPAHQPIANAQVPPADPPVLKALHCYGGAVPPVYTLCLGVPVQRRDGSWVRDATVTVRFDKQSLKARVGQPFDQPAGSGFATFDVGQLGARAGDLVEVVVSSNGLVVRQFVALMPDPKTRTFITDPIVIDATNQLSNSPIWGHVYIYESKNPLAGAKVSLFLGNKLLGSSTTKATLSPTPTFELDPGSIPINSMLRLEASYGERSQSIQFPWSRGPLYLPIVLDWGCIEDDPRRRGGLPESYCLSGSVLLEGTPVSDAQVSIQLGSTTLVTHTSIISGLNTPVFAIDIGELVNSKAMSETLRLTAVKDGQISVLTRSLEELGIGEKWGISLNLPLTGERISTQGLRGGSPVAIAAGPAPNGVSTYAALLGGGLSAQLQTDGIWLRLNGQAGTGLPEPDLTNIIRLKSEAGEDWLLAIGRGGKLALSLRSARTWSPLTAPSGLVAFTAAPAPDGAIVLANQRTLQRTTLDSTTVPAQLVAAGPPITLPFSLTALVVAPDGTLFAGAADGLRSSSDQGQNWKLLRNDSVTALALVQPNKGQGLLLIGTPTRLMRRTLVSGEWKSYGLERPVLGLAAAGAGMRVLTPDGIFGAPADANGTAPTWKPVAGTDQLLGSQPTTGAPDIFDIITLADGRLASASANGVYTSTDRRNWLPLPTAPFTGSVRSLASGPNGAILALFRDGLARFQQGTWTTVSGLPPELNGAVVRASSDGQRILVGRDPGPGASLYASLDGGANWQPLALGADRGVTGIAFFASPQDSMTAVIATDGDGVFGWVPGAAEPLVALPALSSGRVSAITIAPRDTICSIVAATVGGSANIVQRPCTRADAWEAPQELPTPDGLSVSIVFGFAVDANERIYAASSAGVLVQASKTSWKQLFGLPMRPLTVVALPATDEGRQIAVGGLQTGVLLLNDTSPDLAVRLLTPPLVRGGEVLTYTIEVRNFGPLPTPAGTLSLTLDVSGEVVLEPGQLLTQPYPALASGEQVSMTVLTRVATNVRPKTATANVELSVAPSELFEDNNQTSVETAIDYRWAPDLFVYISGATINKPDVWATLRFGVENSGDITSTGGTLNVVVPAGLKTGTTTPTAELQGDRISWPVGAIAPNERYQVVLRYKMPADLAPDATLPISATFVPAGDDREPDNDSDQVFLSLPPEQVNLIALTNFSRLARYGDAKNVRSKLRDVLRQANGLELALDSDPPCAKNAPANNSKNEQIRLACAYDNWDAAVGALAKLGGKGSGRDAAIAAANTARIQLVTAITQTLKSQIEDLPTPPQFLYIVGSDMIIPSAFITDTLPDTQKLLPESDHSYSLHPADSLYSVLAADGYPSDAPYRQIGETRLFVGREAGWPNQIAKALEIYRKANGTIQLTSGSVAGFAPYLTGNTQQWVCEKLHNAGISLDLNCNTIPPGPSAGLAALTQGGVLGSLSEHSDQYAIGDLKSQVLANGTFNAPNVLLLLGCHTGLASDPKLAREYSLASALAKQGQPMFGYSGYAYASEYDASTDSLSYSERMQALLVARLLASGENGMSLGEVLDKAIKDYESKVADDADVLSAKTLNTITLYGLPIYRVRTSRAAEEAAQDILKSLASPGTRAAARALAAQPSLAPAASQSLTTTATFTPLATPDGTVYQAQLTDGGATAVELLSNGHTIQPAARMPLPVDAHGVLLQSGGSFRNIGNIDPLILRAVPLSDPSPYREPGTEAIDHRDWAKPFVVRRDGDGIPQLTLTLGQWSHEWRNTANVQRLYESVPFTILRSATTNDWTPARLGKVSSCRLPNHNLRVTVNADASASRVEVVQFVLDNSNFNQGTLLVTPLHRQGNNWVGTIPIIRFTQFFIQASDAAGNVSLSTNGNRYYIAPDQSKTCS